jgi:hypothetical protein
MSAWNHNLSSKGMTTREQAIVNRLHHLADGPLDPDVRPIVADGLRLIIELIRVSPAPSAADQGRPDAL